MSSKIYLQYLQVNMVHLTIPEKLLSKAEKTIVQSLHTNPKQQILMRFGSEIRSEKQLHVILTK